MIKIDNVSKMYKLGQIGGTTLRDELQRFFAKRKGQEDPTKKIGAKNYNQGETFMALDGVSFEVKKGERVGIIGHNGAGKSTLLKLLSRVTAPTTGEIGLNGRVASMLEVGTGFHGELTGRENIYMNGAILGMTKKEIDAKMEDIIEFSECRQFIDTPVKRYSSGMYVKLAFSVAAHLDSEIMIMDEVLAVGDMKFQQKCLGKMGDVADSEGRTILYVSHNMSTIRQLCTRCVVLSCGRLIYDGDVETAIGIYSNSIKKMEYHYDYRDIIRPPMKGLRFKFLELDILNNPNTPICPGDIVKLKLLCYTTTQCRNMQIRFEIVAGNGSVIGTMFSNIGFNADAMQQLELCCAIDTRNIAPGNYRFDMLAFECNDFGVQDWTDRIEGAFRLELVKNNSMGLIWLPQYWGHVKFNDFLLKVSQA